MSAAVSARGVALIQRAETIYSKTQVLRTFVGSAQRTPARALSSLFSLLGGVASTCSGSVVLGPAEALVGARELYNLSTHPQSTELQRVLSDINADVGMIEVLTEGQQASYQQIGQNLTVIQAGVAELHDKLDAIRQINTQGIEELRLKKQEAMRLNEASLLSFKKAERLLQEARKASEKSNQIYCKCAGLFREIQAVAREEGMPLQERVAALERLGALAFQSCKNGQALLTTSDEKFASAFQALLEANNLKDQALTCAVQTIQKSEDALVAGLEKAEYTKECAEKIKLTQDELEKIKRRSAHIMRLVDSLKQEVKQAKAMAQSLLGPTDVIVGVAVGVAMAPTGPATAITLGVTSAYGFHHRAPIHSAAVRVYNWLKGIKTELISMEPDQLVKADFDRQSTGMWGSLIMGRPSFTAGTMHINLDDEDVVALRFNLNEQFPVAKEDLLDLFHRMIDKLNSGTLNPTRCLALLEELRKVPFDRGDFYPEREGIIHPEDVTAGIVEHIEELCGRT